MIEQSTPTMEDIMKGCYFTQEEARRALAAHDAEVRAQQEELDLAMHRAFRPEVVAEIAVGLDDEANWERIAAWCGGKLDSGPDGTDSGEWDSWITLPNGEVASRDQWIVLGLDGQHRVRSIVGRPDPATIQDIESGAVRDAAAAYPVLTRDMVSRSSVRGWLLARAESLPGGERQGT